MCAHDFAGEEIDGVAGVAVGVGVEIAADRPGGLDAFVCEYP
jgi:hypothetical protein